MNDCGISKLDLKRRNRMQILKVVREQGPISRVDISAILGITRAAVTIITNEMIDQHILQEVGEEPVNPNAEVRKGRRKILLDINETYKFAIGIYVDEKEISIGLTTLNAAALDKKSITHKADMTPEALAELLGTTLEKMLQNSCLTYENLLGIGVGIMPSAFEMMGGSTTDTGCPAFPVLQRHWRTAPACRYTSTVPSPNSPWQACTTATCMPRRKIRSFCTGTAAVTVPFPSAATLPFCLPAPMMPLWNTSV